MKTQLSASLVLAIAVVALPAAGFAQGQPSTDGAARAGSTAGSSPITPTHAPAKSMKSGKSMTSGKAMAARSHRLSPSTAGMGSQAANATGPTSNSH